MSDYVVHRETPRGTRYIQSVTVDSDGGRYVETDEETKALRFGTLEAADCVEDIVLCVLSAGEVPIDYSCRWESVSLAILAVRRREGARS